MEQITIEELYQKLAKRIDEASNLEEFYIGRTDDVEQRRKEHLKNENLPFTIILANGGKNIINEGEIFLQKNFIENPKCSNGRIGGGSEGNTLYISYRNAISKNNTIDDLYDEDFFWEKEYKLIK